MYTDSPCFVPNPAELPPCPLRKSPLKSGSFPPSSANSSGYSDTSVCRQGRKEEIGYGDSASTTPEKRAMGRLLAERMDRSAASSGVPVGGRRTGVCGLPERPPCKGKGAHGQASPQGASIMPAHDGGRALSAIPFRRAVQSDIGKAGGIPCRAYPHALWPAPGNTPHK